MDLGRVLRRFRHPVVDRNLGSARWRDLLCLR
jgi:hypothetical protein